MKQLIFLTDYKGYFGSKYNAIPYNSGLCIETLKKYLDQYCIKSEFIAYSKIDFTSMNLSDYIFIHDSIEDTGYHYKSYIEDVILGLELAGAIVIPGYKYLRAHNNKVFMEILRYLSPYKEIKNIWFKHFGCFEDYQKTEDDIKYPFVFKGAEDAQSRQVRLIENKSSARKIIHTISRTRCLSRELWELGRSIKYRQYAKESKYRKKFIFQQFVPALKNDWKILIFADRYYILRRGVPVGDFRASGSKFNYGFGSKAGQPNEIFDYAQKIYEYFNVPYVSLDIGYNETEFYLIEMQFVSFGSSTQLKSDCFFLKQDGEWRSVNEKFNLEQLYTHAIINYLSRNSLL